MELLLPANENPLPSPKDENRGPGPIKVDGEDEYYRDEIIRCRTWRGKQQAIVKWSGIPVAECTQLDKLQDTIALDKWELLQGSAVLKMIQM